ncbi:MAG: hypothetical protein HRU32_06415 [Rhodobacteraceae bacterium]|nr:hypothetical protein [Paracoccaceae bacterium]
MEYLVWIGAALTLGGVAMLVVCIMMAVRARNSGLDDDALKERLQKVVVLNLGALAVSGLGLMVVIIGLFLT